MKASKLTIFALTVLGGAQCSSARASGFVSTVSSTTCQIEGTNLSGRTQNVQQDGRTQDYANRKALAVAHAQCVGNIYDTTDNKAQFTTEPGLKHLGNDIRNTIHNLTRDQFVKFQEEILIDGVPHKIIYSDTFVAK